MAHQRIPQAVYDKNRLTAAFLSAGFHGRRLARSIVTGDADHDDFQQSILMAILQRSPRHDERRGCWSTFVSLIARNSVADLARSHRSRVDIVPLDALEHVLADKAPCNPNLSHDLREALIALPPSLQQLVDLIAQTGSLADAQRASAMSPSSFYRHVHDLRLRLLMAGAIPWAVPAPRGKKSALRRYITSNTSNRYARPLRGTVFANGE